MYFSTCFIFIKLLIGRRHPIECQYKVGFSNQGLLNALSYTLYIDSGYAIDIGPGVLGTVLYLLVNIKKKGRDGRGEGEEVRERGFD